MWKIFIVLGMKVVNFIIGGLNMKIKIKAINALMVVCILVCTMTSGVFAHEMYYDGTTPVPLKWNDVTNRTAKLKTNGDMLDSNYSSHYSTIRVAWPNASARVSVTDADFSSSNVDLATASSDYWSERWGILYSSYVFGVCDITSTDYYELNSLENAKASSGLIRYAGILFTPNSSAYDNTTHRRMTMVHEIGHALGLGHPNTDYYVTNAASVMRQGTVETYYTPQTHDKNDLNNKY